MLGGAIERWAGTAAVLTMVAAGPVGVALAVLALAARLMVARREITLALAHARGASALQLRGLLAAGAGGAGAAGAGARCRSDRRGGSRRWSGSVTTG